MSKAIKEKVITIKPCDKGAGIIIFNFEEYLRSCNSHLASVKNNKMEHQNYIIIKLNQRYWIFLKKKLYISFKKDWIMK